MPYISQQRRDMPRLQACSAARLNSVLSEQSRLCRHLASKMRTKKSFEVEGGSAGRDDKSTPHNYPRSSSSGEAEPARPNLLPYDGRSLTSSRDGSVNAAAAPHGSEAPAVEFKKEKEGDNECV